LLGAGTEFLKHFVITQPEHGRAANEIKFDDQNVIFVSSTARKKRGVTV